MFQTPLLNVCILPIGEVALEGPEHNLRSKLVVPLPVNLRLNSIIKNKKNTMF